MAIHLVQHGLVDYHSHYYGETGAYISAFKELDIAYQIYCNKKCNLTIVEETGAIPGFTVMPDLVVDPDPVTQELSNYLILGSEFSKNLLEILPKKFEKDDVILFPYVTQVDAYGVALWLSALPKVGRPKVAMVCHHPEFTWQADSMRKKVNANMMFWRFASNIIKKELAIGDVVLITMSERLFELMQHISGLPVLNTGIATPYAMDISNAINGEKPIDVGLVGEYRSERGSQIIPSLLAMIDKELSGKNYLVQVNELEDEKNLREKLRKLGFNGQLKVVLGKLPTIQYTQNLLLNKLVVLPYHPSRYAFRTSGVLSDCAANGIPVVVPGQTWLSDCLDRGQVAGVRFDEFSASSIANSAVSALNNLINLSNDAKSLASIWRKNNNAQVLIEQMREFLRLS